jgi:hypothetical protein
MLNIILWELFKRLVKPNTLTKLVNKYGEDGLKKLLDDHEAADGERGIRHAAESFENAENGFLGGEWLGPLQSSNIDAIRYDESTSRLGVMFKSGAIYEYLDVSYQDAYDFFIVPALQGPDKNSSKGKFLNEVIKPRYAFIKISSGNRTASDKRTGDSGWRSTHHAPKKSRRR